MAIEVKDEWTRDRALRVYAPQIGTWSQKNFGEQKSKWTGLVLSHMAPLLGVAEELGELADAKTPELFADACVDIVVFLCDFSVRFGLDIASLPYHDLYPKKTKKFKQLASDVGTLFHAVLKLHQGIRNSDVDGVRLMLARLVLSVESFYEQKTGLITFWSQFACVVENDVLPRDWTTNAATGKTDEPEGTE